MEPVVSVDLGGTNTRVAIVAPAGDVLAREAQPTARMDQHPDELTSLAKRVSNGSGADRAVISVPGRVDHLLGRLEYAPNLPLHWATHTSEAELAAVGEFVSAPGGAPPIWSTSRCPRGSVVA